MEQKRTAVIGSGPAGLTAAIYLSRANLNPVLFAGSVFGGQLMITTEIDNFPGFPDGIQGPVLMEQMIKQAERFGTEIRYKDVTKIEFAKSPFTVWAGEEHDEFDGIILATGSSARTLGIDREAQLTGRGVSYCATCDGAFFRNSVIAVVGGGDSAMEEATFLTHFASKIYLIHRKESFRASKIMQQKVFDNPKIEVIYNSEVVALNGDQKLTGITIRNTINQSTRDLDVTGLFIAIGHTPNTSVFKDQVNIDPVGYIKLADKTSTNIPGIFSAGDVDDHRYMQAITAAGEGCKAAIDLERYLSGVSI